MTKAILAALAVCVLLPAGQALADTPRDSILAEFLAQAKSADSGFTGFSATRGETLFRATHTGGNSLILSIRLSGVVTFLTSAVRRGLRVAPSGVRLARLACLGFGEGCLSALAALDALL